MVKFRTMTWALAVAVILLAAPLAHADDVVSQAGQGQVNWTQKVVTFTGDGAPNLSGPNAAQNPAQARLGATRAAKMDALRKAIEVVKGVRVDAQGTAGDRMASNNQVAAAVTGVIRNFTTVDVRYYDDGGIQVDVKVPLAGVLTQALINPEKVDPNARPGSGEKVAAKPKDSMTGLIIVAEKLDTMPALAPKITDEQGKVVYDASFVGGSMENGVATYVKGEATAKKHELVSSNPLIVKAVRSPNKVDLVVGKEDAEKIRQLGRMNSVLKQGRVIIAQ